MTQNNGSRQPQINWPTAAVVIAFLGTLTTVAIIVPNETAIIIMVGLAIMGGIGLNVVRSTEAKAEATAAKDVANGNLSRILALVELQIGMLAGPQIKEISSMENQEKETLEHE